MKCLSVVTAGIEEFIAEHEIRGEKASGKGNDGVEICVSDEEHMPAWLPPDQPYIM